MIKVEKVVLSFWFTFARNSWGLTLTPGHWVILINVFLCWISLQDNLAARFNIKPALCLNNVFWQNPFVCTWLYLYLHFHDILIWRASLYCSFLRCQISSIHVNNCSFHSSMCHIWQALHLHFLAGMGHDLSRRIMIHDHIILHL